MSKMCSLLKGAFMSGFIELRAGRRTGHIKMIIIIIKITRGERRLGWKEAEQGGPLKRLKLQGNFIKIRHDEKCWQKPA